MSDTASRPTALLVRAVLAAASALEAAQDELCRLDAVAGDGDEGFAMANAARGIRAELAKGAPGDAVALVNMIANQFASVGGTMGALSFVLMRAISEVPGLGSGPLSAATIAAVLATAEDSVSAFGGAKRGDKTVVDAIAGARDAAQACAQEAQPPAETLIRCAQAASEATAMTADMVARIGRASRLTEQNKGTIDPGAQSFAIALSAIADAYAAGTSSSPSNGPSNGPSNPASEIASGPSRVE